MNRLVAATEQRGADMKETSMAEAMAQVKALAMPGKSKP
jgi:hypothetical protein